MPIFNGQTNNIPFFKNSGDDIFPNHIELGHEQNNEQAHQFEHEQIPINFSTPFSNQQEHEQEQQKFFQEVNEPNQELQQHSPPVRDGIVFNSNHGLPKYAHTSMDLSQDDHMITSHGGNPLDDPSEHKHEQKKRQRTCFGTYTEQAFGHEHSLGFFDDISRKEDENTSQHT